MNYLEKIIEDVKNLDEIYSAAGFDPMEIGNLVYKPTWSKAKEAAKFGGPKKEIIDRYFKPGKPSLEVK
jgi:hypothetical protein